MHAEYWEEEGGIHHSQITSGYLFPFADLLAVPQQLEIWGNPDFYVDILPNLLEISEPTVGGLGLISQRRLVQREKIHKCKPFSWRSGSLAQYSYK